MSLLAVLITVSASFLGGACGSFLASYYATLLEHRREREGKEEA